MVIAAEQLDHDPIDVGRGERLMVAIEIKIGVYFQSMLALIVQMHVQRERERTSIGGGELQMIRRVVLPQALPRLIQSLRLSMGPAWVFLIAALLSEGRDYKTCGRPCETPISPPVPPPQSKDRRARATKSNAGCANCARIKAALPRSAVTIRTLAVPEGFPIHFAQAAASLISST